MLLDITKEGSYNNQHIWKIFKTLLDMIASSLNYYEKNNIMTRKEIDDFIRTKRLDD